MRYSFVEDWAARRPVIYPGTRHERPCYLRLERAPTSREHVTAMAAMREILRRRRMRGAR